MDDIPASVESEEVAGKLMSDAEKLLAAKNFKIKSWTFSGRKVQKDRSKDQAAVQALLRRDIDNELRSWECHSLSWKPLHRFS